MMPARENEGKCRTRENSSLTEHSAKLFGDIRHLNEGFIADSGNTFGVQLEWRPCKFPPAYLDRGSILARGITASHIGSRFGIAAKISNKPELFSERKRLLRFLKTLAEKRYSKGNEAT